MLMIIDRLSIQLILPSRAMSELYHTDENFKPPYWDRKYYTSFEDQIKALNGSATIYVGNLSFYTSELQIHETMSIVGPIKRIIMGLNKNTKMPCGFCFVEYFTHEHAVECLKFINQSKCDDRIIKCELDGGFHEGRQYGRGVAGGQIRDERRTTDDAGRGALVLPDVLLRQQQQDSVLGKRRDRGPSNASEGKRFSGGFRTAGTDRFGRDARPPPPPPTNPDGALSSQRRPPPPPHRPPTFTENVASRGEEQGQGEDGRGGDDAEDQDRPRKNPRFRDADKEDEE